jgi:adenylosuccinate lyase
LRARASFDIARIEEIEGTTQHDVIAFTTAVAERAGPSARWFHFGLTSSDVLDTALALQMRDACDLILRDLDALAEAIRTRAEEHRRTPMIGRTHGVHAEPMRPRPDPPRARNHLRRQAVRRRRDVRAPRSVD